MSMSAPFRSMENGNPNKEENATNHPGTSTEPEKMSRAERLKKIRADIQAKKQKKLTIANMNDFVAPNPDCIIVTKKEEIAADGGDTVKSGVVNIKKTGLQRTTAGEAKNKVKLTLDDCLVCSGCVTTSAIEFF